MRIACIRAGLAEPIPPSVNALYTVVRGRKLLTAAGKKFKAALQREVVGACMLHTTPWISVVDAVYDEIAYAELTVVLTRPVYVKAVYAERWKAGSKTEKGARSSPYQKWDGTSYVKVIEDAVVEGTGIDDSANLATHVYKQDGPFRVDIIYEVYRDDRAQKSRDRQE